MPRLIRILTMLSLSLWGVQSFGQYIQGKITDENKKYLAYASIYVKNSTKGVSADQRGFYFMELPAGTYTIVFSFIGYTNQEYEVVISSGKPVKLDVQMFPETSTLYAAEVVADTRDRGEEIMKNVRDKRKYYFDRVGEYACETYMKTSLEKELMRPSKKDTIHEEGDTTEVVKRGINGHFKREKLNLIETVSTTYFRSPGRYKEVVSAHHDYAERPGSGEPGRSIHMGSGMDDFGSKNIAPVSHASDNPYILFEDFSKADLNFYQNLIEFSAVSQKPLLSPIALNSGLSYRFDYKGSFIEDNRRIYEIDVTPLFKSGALFEGKIFVEDSTWALVTVDLQINRDVLLYCNEFRVIQNYSHYENDQLVPIRRELTYTIKDGKYDILGNTRVEHHNYDFHPEIERGFFNAEVKQYTDDAFDKDSAY
ncbi:MAG: carboxypeptidase-like regulatory domain-containing protein [Flavobacteriales bacterium]|nr:carboxypeptidase-like regulatory domain-containing protein [Flavobacteriales bacterium]